MKSARKFAFQHAEKQAYSVKDESDYGTVMIKLKGTRVKNFAQELVEATNPLPVFVPTSQKPKEYLA